ncbi:MAG: hypothetical protein SPD90_14770 [Intestinibacter sp.]|uniref:hypothetical protein n=1 Tax=Intestinibacter sp. TaxID=1965304 RepID=UPI002A81008E|nr:hypothetical protein [Intestinibacter sp.]MDY4576312.1 hypothetical protein [Intestinibacter sp.]
MKIALLAPEVMGKDILRMAKKDIKDVDISLLIYNDYKDCVNLLKSHEKEYDGIIFAGLAPYTYSKMYLAPKAIWEYLPLQNGSLTNCLLQAVYAGYDIKNISIDLYSSSDLSEVFRILNVDLESIKINSLHLKIDNENYNEIAFNFHKRNYENNKDVCIITAFNTVHYKLLENNITNFMTVPTKVLIKDTFQKVILKYNAKVNKESQIVIGYIEINFPDEYSIINMHDYYYVKEKNKISEIIYSFAQDIKAAVTEVSFNTYQLVSTRNVLEVETDNFREFEILNSVSENSLHNLSIGFGYGKTADEAKLNANLAMMKSKKIGESCVYVIYENKEVIGPIKNKAEKKEEKIDSKLMLIAENCNVSINKIFSIYNAIDKYQKNTFTPKEISDICKMSIRSTNKLLAILENHGYTEIVGKKFSNGSGRPTRIIKFKF